VDVYHNEANCGQCGVACKQGEFCLFACQTPDAPSLCTNNPQDQCDDDVFCNGSGLCDPTSNLAGYGGCVASPAPCPPEKCDDENKVCEAPPPGCDPTPTFYTDPSGRCGAVQGCLSLGAELKELGSSLACGGEDQTPPADGNDELGVSYDCNSCLRNDLMICAQQNGCAAEVDALYCCAQKVPCTTTTCIQQGCMDEFSALDACVDKGNCLGFLVDTVCLSQ